MVQNTLNEKMIQLLQTLLWSNLRVPEEESTTWKFMFRKIHFSDKDYLKMPLKVSFSENKLFVFIHIKTSKWAYEEKYKTHVMKWAFFSFSSTFLFITLHLLLLIIFGNVIVKNFLGCPSMDQPNNTKSMTQN